MVVCVAAAVAVISHHIVQAHPVGTTDIAAPRSSNRPRGRSQCRRATARTGSVTLVECAVVISVVSPVNGNALYGCVISVANRRVECVHHAGCNSVCVSPTTMPGASADGCRTGKLLRFEWCYSQRLNMPRTEVRDDLRFLKLCKIINRF